MGKTQTNRSRNAGTGGRRQPAGGKRAATRSSKSQLTNGLEDPAQVERELTLQLKSMGLYAANTMGDGNCLWRALSDQLYGTPGLHFTLRQEVCDHLECSPEKYAGFVDNDKPFSEYVALMRQNGTYGGHLELSAFAQLKQKVVKVVQPGLVYLVSGDDEGVRERKEKEREIAQSKSSPGSEGPPPTEREQRRLRRAARARSSSPVKQAVATKQEREAEQEAGPSKITAEDSGPIEAFGPLYIAYHNWEHYSSVRNLAGPHQGLPRIQVQLSSIAASGAASSTGPAIKGKALGKKKAQGGLPEEDEWVADDDPEPTQDEALVLQSCPGHDLQVVRQMIHIHGDWESAVEALIAQDSGELESPVASGSSSTRMRNGKLLPLPDHLRQYRATSPASVETNGTRSSEGGSVSTTATTEELSPVDDLSRSASPMVMPRHKRAASSDIMSASMTRSPKRRSRSRSPVERNSSGVGEVEDSDSDSRRASMDVQVSNTDEGGSVGKESTPSQSSGSATTNTTARATPSSTSKAPPKATRLTARQKRDAEQQRKRERNQAKVTGRVGGKGVDSNSNSRGSTAEVKGFIELKI